MHHSVTACLVYSNEQQQKDIVPNLMGFPSREKTNFNQTLPKWVYS